MTIPGIYTDTTGRIWNITTKPRIGFRSEANDINIWYCQELDENDDDMGDRQFITVFNESTQAFRDGGKVIRQIYKRTVDQQHIVRPIAVIMMPEEGEFGHGVVHESFTTHVSRFARYHEYWARFVNTGNSIDTTFLKQFAGALEALFYLHRLCIIQHNLQANPYTIDHVLDYAAFGSNKLKSSMNICRINRQFKIHGFHNAIHITPYHLRHKTNPTYSFKEDYMTLFASFRVSTYITLFYKRERYIALFAREVDKLPNLDIPIPYNIISSFIV